MEWITVRGHINPLWTNADPNHWHSTASLGDIELNPAYIDSGSILGFMAWITLGVLCPMRGHYLGITSQYCHYCHYPLQLLPSGSMHHNITLHNGFVFITINEMIGQDAGHCFINIHPSLTYCFLTFWGFVTVVMDYYASCLIVSWFNSLFENTAYLDQMVTSISIT